MRSAKDHAWASTNPWHRFPLFELLIKGQDDSGRPDFHKLLVNEVTVSKVRLDDSLIVGLIYVTRGSSW